MIKGAYVKSSESTDINRLRFNWLRFNW